MCFFITVAVPYEHAAVAVGLVRRGLHVHKVASKSILKHLPPGMTLFILTSGMCSCDLFSRVTKDDDDPKKDHMWQRRQKYEKQGWSKAKIDRALAQTGSHVMPEVRFEGLRTDVRQLVADLSNEIGTFAIACHMYSGDIETEKFNVTIRGKPVSAANVRDGKYCLAEDTIVFVKP